MWFHKQLPQETEFPRRLGSVAGTLPCSLGAAAAWWIHQGRQPWTKQRLHWVAHMATIFLSCRCLTNSHGSNRQRWKVSLGALLLKFLSCQNDDATMISSLDNNKATFTLRNVLASVLVKALCGWLLLAWTTRSAKHDPPIQLLVLLVLVWAAPSTILPDWLLQLTQKWTNHQAIPLTGCYLKNRLLQSQPVVTIPNSTTFSGYLGQSSCLLAKSHGIDRL